MIVLAQEEARRLNHNYIGTEHLLLGLIHEGESVAARALEALGISLDDVREEIKDIVGQGASMSTGHMPFTPRAKKVMELSLRESLQLNHNYIGTEHLLLALVREGEGVAAQVLRERGAELERVRAQVSELLPQQASRTAGAASVRAGTPPEPEAIRLEGAAAAMEPRCPRCRSELRDTIAYRVLEIRPVDGEGEVRSVAFAFCRRCGTSYGALS